MTTMSLPPTYGLMSPLASVLTSSFGIPNGASLIAADPIVEPADPPIAKTPSRSPFTAISAARLAAPSAALATA